MKKTQVKGLTVIGLIAIILLQSMWLYNTYNLIKNNIKEKANASIVEATNIELYSRFHLAYENIPDGTELSATEVSVTGKRTSGNPQLQEICTEYGFDISLPSIDSIYTQLLENENIRAKKTINIVNNDGTIIKSNKEEQLQPFATITTQPITIRTDGSQSIQAVILNPYWAIFQQMWLLLIATIIMAIFVVGCIAYQIKIIIRQNRIAQLRQDFSNAMIHDMKSPITSITMGAKMLGSGKLEDSPERKNRYLKILEDEANHLQSLADKVLTIAKSEEDKLVLNKQHIKVSPIIYDLIEKFEAKNKKPIIFLTNFEADSIYADPYHLREMVSNLIDNAVKYSGDTVEISITVSENNKQTQIKVRDNGLGIPLKHQTKIFEKFERAAAVGRSRKGGATGFGLGLNYVLHVTEAHGGKVSIDSIEGQYSEFSINVPILLQEI